MEAKNFWQNDGTEKPQAFLKFSMLHHSKSVCGVILLSKVVYKFVDLGEIFSIDFEAFENRKMVITVNEYEKLKMNNE